MAKNEHKKDLRNLSEAYESIFNGGIHTEGAVGAGLGAGIAAAAAPLLPFLGPLGVAAAPVAAAAGGLAGDVLTGDEEETADDPHIEAMADIAQGLAALDDDYMNNQMSDQGKQAWQEFIELIQSEDRGALDAYTQKILPGSQWDKYEPA